MTLAQLNNENIVDLDSLDLKSTDFENILNVYQDSRSNWFYNLNTTTNISVDENLILTYQVTFDSHWPLLAYNIYGTTRLAWVLLQLNNITAENIFKPILAGETIKYIDKKYIRTIITSLQDYDK